MFVSNNRDVIVFLESFGERAEKINKGLLAEGSRIAGLLGGGLSALCTDSSEYSSDALARTAKTILENTPFRLLLFAHTDASSELAPLVAMSLGASAVLDCFDIRIRDKTLHYVRRVCGGQFEQEVSYANPPEIASLNLELLMDRESVHPAPAHFKRIHLRMSADAARKKIIETVPPDFKTMDIRYAKRILDIGSGCDQPVLRNLAQELSNLLEASIGATRPVIDDGHISKSRMIGQTGKTVSPELLLALGVSGSPHHVDGIRQIGTVLSVNSDMRAPILGISDAGFIADLNGLLPKLINLIKRYRDKDLT
jgi:electron transfer flavoprotein alpha subunit